MLARWIKAGLVTSTFLACAAMSLGQINPATQIRWPANCNASGMTYNQFLNSCIAGGPGPQGPPGPAGPPGGSLSYPGVTSDGNNGLTVTGGVNAATVGANGIGNPNTSATLTEVVGSMQPLHAAALRATRTKTGLMTLNNMGYSGYSNPAQLVIYTGGDSTTGFHANEFACTLATEFGFSNQWAGYIGTTITGTNVSEGFTCPPAGWQFVPTLAGGATNVGGDFAHFPAGTGVSMPPGSTATNTAGFQMTANKIMVYYTADTAGATVTVNTSPDGTTWTAIPSCTALVVTPHVAGVCDATVTLGPYWVQVVAGGSATLYLWTAGMINTTVNGAVFVAGGVGGTSLPDQTSIPSAIWQPWLNDIKPDLVTFEMKNNGTMVLGYPTCTQATTAAPTVGQNRLYWWNKWITPFLTANALADVVIFGSHGIAASNDCIAVYNQVEQQWAYAQQPAQTYVDNYWQLSNAQMQTLGWIDTTVHETILGQIAHGDLDVEYLGIMNWPTALVTRNVANGSTQSSIFKLGTQGKIDYNTSFPNYWRFTTTATGSNNLRGFSFINSSGTAWAQLCDTSAGGPCTTVDKSWLPPFQLYLSGTAVNASGVWLHGTQIQSGNINAAGFFDSATAVTPWPLVASNVSVSTNNLGSTSSGNVAVNTRNHYTYVGGMAGAVTGQTYTSGSNNANDITYIIAQGTTAYPWTWSGTNETNRSGFRVPVIPAASGHMAQCVQELVSMPGGVGQILPKTAALCYYNLNSAQGDTGRQYIDVDAVLTGTSTNVDGAGELSLSAATTVSYTFYITTLTVHPECVVTPQFDIGSGNRYWVTYTAATSFTVNFATAVTGAVSYVCTIRT